MSNQQSRLEVNGHTYSVGRLNPMTQFHITRRLAPILAQMGISLQALGQGSKSDLTDFLPLLGPVSDIMAKMTDEDADYIVYTCLAVVSRLSGEKWSRVTTGNNMMYDDIDMPTMLRLVVEVVKENLGSFMRGLLDAPESAAS